MIEAGPIRRAAVCAAAILSAVLSGGCQGGGDLRVSDAWARPADAGQNSALYFSIENPAGSSDELLSVRGAAARSLEMHLSRVDDNGVVSMQRQGAVRVPAGGKVDFQPGGLHVMLVDLQRPLRAGDFLDVTLVFKNAGEIALKVEVRER